MFSYFLFTYIVRQVSDPKMASLPNHYVANSSSFGNTPKHTGHTRFHRGPTDSGTTPHNTHTRAHTSETVAVAEMKKYFKLTSRPNKRALSSDDITRTRLTPQRGRRRRYHVRIHTRTTHTIDIIHTNGVYKNKKKNRTKLNQTSLGFITSARPLKAAKK